MSVIISPPEPAYLRRWMLFVDGENFTIRGQTFASSNGISLNDDTRYLKDTFLWFHNQSATQNLLHEVDLHVKLQVHATRSFYYTSVQGDHNLQESVETRLHNLGFNPRVFKKQKGIRSKGVDVTLTTDMLNNAHDDNFDAAVLIAGDGDFAPLVDAVKRLGKVVYVFFFAGDGDGLNKKLKLASDRWIDATLAFQRSWSAK